MVLVLEEEEEAPLAPASGKFGVLADDERPCNVIPRCLCAGAAPPTSVADVAPEFPELTTTSSRHGACG